VAYKVAVGFEFFDDTNDIPAKLDSFHLADELRDSGGKMILVTANAILIERQLDLYDQVQRREGFYWERGGAAE
jgi:hypothetical protein